MASGAGDMAGPEPPAGTVRADGLTDAESDAAARTGAGIDAGTGAGIEDLGDPSGARRAGLRSLPDARSRQTEVTNRLVEWARELVWEAGGPTFTASQGGA